MRLRFLVGALLAIASCRTPDYDAVQLNRLDGVIEAAIRNGDTPGAVARVWHRGDVIYDKSFGYRATWPRREAMTPDTIFDMASLTKVMATATSTMILVEEGRLSLTDRVSDYLEDFTDGREGCQKPPEESQVESLKSQKKPNRGKEELPVYDKDCVTILHLLTHYSGLRPDVDLDEYWSGYEEAIRLGHEEILESQPGDEFVYSDINYFMLAEIVRVVSGKRIDEFSRERIFQPLGMVDTGFLPDSEQRSRIAPTERRVHHDRWAPDAESGEIMRGRVHDPTTDRMGGVAGHAGLFSTIGDTLRFTRMILNGGDLDGVRILSPLGVRAMTTPQSPPGQHDLRGLGFDINSRFSTNRGDLFPVGSFGHTGFTGTSLWIDPESETIVLLFTSRLHPDGEGNVVSLRKKVASVVAASLRSFE